MVKPTIASAALRKLLAAAATIGVDPRTILDASGVAPEVVEDRDGRVPILALHAAWEKLLAHTPGRRSDFIGVGAYAPGDYGLVGFVVMSSATVGEALAHFVRYIGLWTDEPVFQQDGPAVHFAYRRRFPDTWGRRGALESAPVEIVHGARLVTQMRIVPREVRFAHPAADDASKLEAFLGCPVRFDARDNALVFREQDLAIPLVKADPNLVAYLRGVANAALAKRAADPSPLDRVREVIASELSRGVPTMDVVTRRLGMSQRTLRRRLDADGTSFRELLDDTRARLARSYVGDARMPLSEVAFLLGFSEPSAFHRAFKRWTRTTPAAWRERNGSA